MAKKDNKELDLYNKKLDNYYGNPNDYGNTVDDSNDFKRNLGNVFEDTPNDYANSHNRNHYENTYEDDSNNFADEMYKSYIRKNPKKRSYFSTIILTLLTFSVLIGQITLLIYRFNLNTYNELNDSYIKLFQYKYIDLERTETTSYPKLIKIFPETKNFKEYSLPCSIIHPELKDVFNTKLIKRKLEDIKNLPLEKTDLYINLANKINDSIDDYRDPVYPSAFDILQKPSVTNLKQTFDILNSWLWASLYYTSQNMNKEALLLAYAPILVCQDIETNSADGADINIDMIEVQIAACKQLLYLANYAEIDEDLCQKIYKNFNRIVNLEPSFTRKIENRMRCDNNFFSIMEKKGNAFAKYINNSKIYKDMYNILYNGAIEQTKEIELTGNYSKFYTWQKEILTKFQIPTSNKKDSSKDVSNIEATICKKAFSHSVIDFFDYYCLNIEKITIMKGTALALGIKANKLKRDKKALTNNMPVNKIYQGTDIPKDSSSRIKYDVISEGKKVKFYTSIIKNQYYNCIFIKDYDYFPLFLKY